MKFVRSLVIVRTACGYYYQYWFALDEDEMLENNDLKLIEKNTGETFAHSKNKLTCLRCGSNSRSPPVASISRYKSAVKSSEDDQHHDLAVSTRYPCDLANEQEFLIFGMPEVLVW
jgi:hypothetical protein